MKLRPGYKGKDIQALGFYQHEQGKKVEAKVGQLVLLRRRMEGRKKTIGEVELDGLFFEKSWFDNRGTQWEHPRSVGAYSNWKTAVENSFLDHLRGNAFNDTKYFGCNIIEEKQYSDFKVGITFEVKVKYLHSEVKTEKEERYVWLLHYIANSNNGRELWFMPWESEFSSEYDRKWIKLRHYQLLENHIIGRGYYPVISDEYIPSTEQAEDAWERILKCNYVNTEEIDNLSTSEKLDVLAQLTGQSFDWYARIAEKYGGKFNLPQKKYIGVLTKSR